MTTEPDDDKPKNGKLIAARLRLPSPSGSGEPMSTQEVAEAMNLLLWTEHQKTPGSTAPTVLDHRFVSAYENGRFWWPSRHYRAAFRSVLKATTDAELGFHKNRRRRPVASTLPIATGTADAPQHPGVAGRFSGADHETDDRAGPSIDLRQDDTVRRRQAISVLGGIASGAALSRLLDLLMLPTPQVGMVVTVPVQRLVDDVTTAKITYQACRYSQALDQLAVLLPSIEATRSHADADEAAVLDAAATDLYHVLGSVLLKVGDRAMALVAAERSVRCALASHDPIAAGTSARIMTHALMSNGHAAGAVRLAQTAAGTMERDTHLRSTDAAAVYGALVLRGSIAAARSDDRDAAGAMLDEAARVANRLGRDGNDRWTWFGPTNVLLHRVNTALTLGDAGAAIALARQVPLDKVTLPERRASLFVDVAQAYTQWGRHEQGLAALRTAHRIAPQEIRTRPAVHRIVGDLAALSHGETRTSVVGFAASVGIRL